MAFKFDKTVNLGQVIAAASFLAAGAGLWSRMDSRVTALEERTSAAVTLANERASRVDESLRELKQDVRIIINNDRNK